MNQVEFEETIEKLVHEYEIAVYYKERFKVECQDLLAEYNELLKENRLLTELLDKELKNK